MSSYNHENEQRGKETLVVGAMSRLRCSRRVQVATLHGSPPQRRARKPEVICRGSFGKETAGPKVVHSPSNPGAPTSRGRTTTAVRKYSGFARAPCFAKDTLAAFLQSLEISKVQRIPVNRGLLAENGHATNWFTVSRGFELVGVDN
jgi:hypothetical protein